MGAEKKKAEKLSWGWNSNMSQTPSPQHMPHFSAGLTRHNSKIKLLKFQDGDSRALNPKVGGGAV